MRLRHLLEDESGLILKSVIKWGVIVAVVAVIIVAVGPLVWMRIFSVQNADEVASASATDYRLYHDEEKARTAAAEKLRLMGYSDEEIKECVVQFLPPGNVTKQTVKVTVVRHADTFLTDHINALKKYAKVSTTAEASIGGE